MCFTLLASLFSLFVIFNPIFFSLFVLFPFPYVRFFPNILGGDGWLSNIYTTGRKISLQGAICNRQLVKIMVNYLGDILCCVGPEAAVAGECRECCANGAVGHLTARDQRRSQTTRYPGIFSSSIPQNPTNLVAVVTWASSVRRKI
jgi:hypothetical protein